MIKMKLVGALGVFGLVVAACAGGGSEDSEDGSSDECSSDSDCKGERICSDGACVDQPSPNGGSTGSAPPPSCSDVGESCASTGCCNDSNALCVDYGGSLGTVCADRCDQGSDCQTGCCGGLQDGGGTCAPVEYCDWGVPCSGNEYCNSNVCIGWCSEYCSDSNDCASNGWCYSTNGGSQYCFPECSTNADCSMYPGSVCELYETVDGYDIWTCS